MTEKSIHSKLRETFSVPTAEQWKQIASQELEGKSVDEVLSWNSEDAIRFSAYYDLRNATADDFSKKFRLTVADDPYFGPAKWLNLPSVTVTSDKNANALALHHLTNGADGIIFNFEHPLDLNLILKDIEWQYCAMFFQGSQADKIHADVVKVASKQSVDQKNVVGGFIWDRIPTMEHDVFTKTKLLNVFRIESSSPINEIVNALNSGVAAIERFSNDPRFTKSIGFSLNASENFFETVAKFKALRFLWMQVVHAYGIKDFHCNDLFLHARSEPWLKEKFQPHGNMLKGTTAAMASVMGGVDAITIYPEDESNTMMTRVARNISNLIREESHFDKVADPSLGSYAIDTMVNSFASNAWQAFQQSQKS